MRAKSSAAMAVVLLAVGVAAAEDWSEWRGPRKDGVLQKSPALMDSIPAEGLKLLWQVPALGGGEGNYSSPVAAKGKVYAHVTPVEKKETVSADGKKRGTKTGADVMLCVDVANGTVIWEKTYPVKPGGWGASNTPCVAGGKVYFVGCAGTVYCLDANTGEEAWKAESLLKGDKACASPTVVDGKLVLTSSKGMVALDVADGKESWRNKDVKSDCGSAGKWVVGKKTYLIAAGKQLACVDSADGKVLWTLPGAERCWTTPAIVGDVMTFMFQGEEAITEVIIYRLSPAGAKKVVAYPVPTKSKSCSASMDGRRIYALTSQKGMCLDAGSGEVIWDNAGHRDTYTSPILADGKLLCNNKKQFILFDAATGEQLGAVAMPLGEVASVGLANGRLVVRGKTHLMCYDLRKK